MKISTLLDHVDSGHMALPEFQRGYVWSWDRVRALFSSLYKKYPVGGLLVWATESKTAIHRGEGPIAAGIVKLLLDGQQRITSLYGVLRGKPPKFFDGNAQAFTGLHFHLEEEKFAFYQPLKMQGDPLWVNVTELMKQGADGLGNFVAQLTSNSAFTLKAGEYIGRLSRLLGIRDTDLYVEEVTGPDKTLDVVVDIFNLANSSGTKLSKGDLALAKICVDWPEARDTMKAKLKGWREAHYDFNLDWLLRSLNTVLTGEAKFSFLHDKTSAEIQDGLERASKAIDNCLNLIGGRLGLDHDRVFFGRFAIPIIVRYLDRSKGTLGEKERDKLLFWFIQAGMWGRFSCSTESFIDQDLSALDKGGVDRLLEQLKLWHGGLRVASGHFTGWSLGARFYPILYMLTRMGEARDWGTGLPLKANLLGMMSRLEVHHVFPKAQLYSMKYKRPEVNALANFCFLTKDTNLAISDRLPQEYFAKIEDKHPGALASQWIPMDRELWKAENYIEFLEERKRLLAKETNRLLQQLLHDELQWLEEPAIKVKEPSQVLERTTSEAEEGELEALNRWMEDQGLPAGILALDFSDAETGEQKAVFDLAWPNGIQEELSQPVAILLDETKEIFALASTAGYRTFSSVCDFQKYVQREILGIESEDMIV